MACIGYPKTVEGNKGVEARIPVPHNYYTHTVVRLLDHVHSLLQKRVRHSRAALTADNPEDPVLARNLSPDDNLIVQAVDSHAAMA